MNKLDQELERLAIALEKDMRAEAVYRLKTIASQEPELVEQFAKNGTVYIYDFTPSTYDENNKVINKNGLRVANEKEMEIVRYMESEQGNLPYLMIKRTNEFRLFYDVLYVGYEKKKWNNERSSIQKHGRTYSEPYVFEVETDVVPTNLDGTIDLKYHRFTEIKLNLD